MSRILAAEPHERHATVNVSAVPVLCRETLIELTVPVMPLQTSLPLAEQLRRSLQLRHSCVRVTNYRSPCSLAFNDPPLVLVI